jgi:hypothetical protein
MGTFSKDKHVKDPVQLVDTLSRFSELPRHEGLVQRAREQKKPTWLNTPARGIQPRRLTRQRVSRQDRVTLHLVIRLLRN